MREQSNPKPNQFINDALDLCPAIIVVPNSTKDFGMYETMNAAFDGLHEYLDNMRSNYGRIGYAAQNTISDLSKAFIEAVQRGADETELGYISLAMEKLAEGFNDVEMSKLPESPTQFGRTVWQEKMEADLFGLIWPVVSGKTDSVPELIFWKDFKGNVQAYLYGYIDLVSELGKALDYELSDPDMTVERELDLYERYLAIAASITLRLSQERHVPGYVINNGYGRWVAYTNKLRTAYGTIAHVRREYNLRRSIQRMINHAAYGLTKKEARLES